MNITHVVNSVR